LTVDGLSFYRAGPLLSTVVNVAGPRTVAVRRPGVSRSRASLSYRSFKKVRTSDFAGNVGTRAVEGALSAALDYEESY